MTNCSTLNRTLPVRTVPNRTALFLTKTKKLTKTKSSPLNEIMHVIGTWQMLFSHSVMSDSATPWTAAGQASLSITISWNLLKLMSIESVMPSSHLILCRPLLLLPSIFPSLRVFSKESVLHIRWPKTWSFSFSISPSNEYSEFIFFRIDWFDLLAV